MVHKRCCIIDGRYVIPKLATTLKSDHLCGFMDTRLSYCGVKELDFFNIQSTLMAMSIESVPYKEIKII